MLRRKRRTAKQQALLAYKQAAPFGIGVTQDQLRALAHKAEQAVITAVHDYIWATRPSCQLCHGARKDECMGLPDQMHEDPPRSKTRGLPPVQRFNLIVCGRLCAVCHRDVTENKLRIVYSAPALGFLAHVHGIPTESVSAVPISGDATESSSGTVGVS